MSAARRKGTAWESAIVLWLRPVWPAAERRALGGRNDRGDIAGVPSTVLSAKDHSTWRLSEWVTEVERQRLNDKAAFAAVWIRKRGKTSPGDAYVVMDGRQFTALLRAAHGLEETP